jgi:putative hydrolase of the HAD superfamily
MSRARAIVFDLDWTLYDADRFYLEAWNRVACEVASRTRRDAGELCAALVHVWRAHGPADRQLFDRWLQAVELPAQPWVQVARDVLHAEWAPRIEPHACAVALLRGLKPRFRLGLLTEGNTATQERKLRALALRPHFDAVHITASKRDGLAYRQICHDLAVDPSCTLAVGDRVETDLEPARGCGAATCLVRQGPFGARQPLPHAADWNVETLEVLLPVVAAWKGAGLRSSET